VSKAALTSWSTMVILISFTTQKRVSQLNGYSCKQIEEDHSVIG